MWTFHSNPGRFAPITCSPRVDSPGVISPREMSRFSPLNRYYIIVDDVFFDNFFGNYSFISCMIFGKRLLRAYAVLFYYVPNQNKVLLFLFLYEEKNSFILVYFSYLFISCIQKKSFILVYFCQRSQAKLFLQNFQKNHIRTVKRLGFFAPTQKCMNWLRCCTSAQITYFLMNYASNAKIV